MIPLAFLAGGAVFLALRTWASLDLIAALAGGVLVLVVVLSIADVLQERHDRRTAYRRWNGWDR